jgi:hypothetical protein
MSTYETSTTVGGQGEIHLAALPFQPGTKVDVVVSPVCMETPAVTDVSDRIAKLFAALDLARNNRPIGALRREELYDRNNLH